MNDLISATNLPRAGDRLSTTDTFGATWNFQVYDEGLREPGGQCFWSCAFTSQPSGGQAERGVWRFPLLDTLTPLYRV